MFYLFRVVVTFGMFWLLMPAVCRLRYSGYSFGNVWVCFGYSWLSLGYSGLSSTYEGLPSTLGVCLGYSVIIIGHPGLGLGLGDSGVCFSFLMLSFGNFEECRGFSGSRFGYFWAQFLYLQPSLCSS